MRYSLIAVVLMVQVAFGAELDERLMMDPDGLVKIVNLRGEVFVEAWDKSEVLVEGDLDELATRLRFETTGKVTEIEVVMPKQNVNWGDSSDLKIYVPKQSRVTVDGVSSDIEVSGVEGGVKLRTISGEIEVSDSQGRIHLNTVSGEIEVNNSVGTLHAKSSSGEVDVQDHIGDLDVESLSGSVKVEASKVKRVRGATVSGEMEMTLAFVENIAADIRSVSGAIQLSVKKPRNFVLRATSTSGSIDNDLSKDAVVKRFGMRSINAHVGDAQGDVQVHTVSGSIELEEG